MAGFKVRGSATDSYLKAVIMTGGTSNLPESPRIRAVIIVILAGVVQWQNISFPS